MAKMPNNVFRVGAGEVHFGMIATDGLISVELPPVKTFVLEPPNDIKPFAFNLPVYAGHFSFSGTLTNDELAGILTPNPDLVRQVFMLVNGHEVWVTYDPTKNDDGTYSYPAEYIGPAEHAPGASWATKAYYEGREP